MSAVLSWLPDWLRVLLSLGVIALAAIVAIAALRAAATLGTMALEAGCNYAGRLTNWLTAAFVATGIGVVGVVRIVLLTVAQTARSTVAAKTASLRRWLKLWRAWRHEFRDDFATFGEFVAAFERGGQPRQKPRPSPPPPPPPDPRQAAYSAACRLLGLPESGLTLPQLKARHRVLISAMHPDRKGGDTERAARLNAACDLIKRTKGWNS